MHKAFTYLIILIALTACSDNNKPYKIGVAQCSQGRWREKVNNEMLAAQHLYEQDVEVSIADSHDDTELQIHQIDSLADSGIDLLVVAPNESAPISKAIARVRQKGIPVIFFDRKAATNEYTAFIGGNNVDAGQAVAAYALQLAGKLQAEGIRPKILEITATMTTSPAQERHNGFETIMKAHPEIDYSYINCEWSTDDVYHVVKQRLASEAIPNIIFCHSDFMAMGAYKAAKEAKKEKQIKILGIDGMLDEGIDYVKKGYIAGTYIYPTHGEEIVRLALNILTGKPFKHENNLPSMMVTPENVDIVALNSKELFAQNNDLIIIHDKLENYFGLYNTQHKILIGSLISIFFLLMSVFLTLKAVKQTRKAHRKMVKLNEEQTLFYTNASHQLKTPLTLIAGPVKELLKHQSLKSEEQELLEIVNRNVAKLEALTSDVLSFHTEMKAAVSDETAAEMDNQAVSSDVMRESRLAILKQEDTDELPSILIVDDNNDMRNYLRTILADKFYVIEAADGQNGLKLARDIVPDIIVSDVMMPIMDGLQLCHQLKEDSVTCHIPVILLTARSTGAQQMEGYEHGADAYLTKPFHADLLISRIYNLVKSRQQLRSLFETAEPELQDPTEAIGKDKNSPAAISSQDNLFANALKEAIKKNMSNPSLKMDELGEDLGLSRVQLYRKVKALTGLSPVELLRQMRLQRGYVLLQTTNKTVNEIAYEVGYGTPGYFSKCFKQQFGKYPMDVRAE